MEPSGEIRRTSVIPPLFEGPTSTQVSSKDFTRVKPNVITQNWIEYLSNVGLPYLQQEFLRITGSHATSDISVIIDQLIPYYNTIPRLLEAPTDETLMTLQTFREEFSASFLINPEARFNKLSQRIELPRSNICREPTRVPEPVPIRPTQSEFNIPVIREHAPPRINILPKTETFRKMPTTSSLPRRRDPISQ